MQLVLGFLEILVIARDHTLLQLHIPKGLETSRFGVTYVISLSEISDLNINQMLLGLDLWLT